MTGTDILSTLNTQNMNLNAGGNYKPLRSKDSDESADFTMVMTAKISTSVQELSAKSGNGSLSVTATSRTVRAEVFSISTNAKSPSLSSQNNLKSLSSNTATATGKDGLPSLSKDDLTRIQKALDDFKTGVNDVLKQELGVSDEDIENAMETLGLSYLDLTDVNALAQLMMQLLGTDFDAGSLLSMQNFPDIKNAINDLAQDLFQTTGLTGDQLSAVDQFLTEAAAEGIDISDLTPADGTETVNIDLSNTTTNTEQTAADPTAVPAGQAGTEIPVQTLAADDLSAEASVERESAEQTTVSADDTVEILPETADTTADTGAETDGTAETVDLTAPLTEEDAPAEDAVEVTALVEEEPVDDKTNDLADLSDENFDATTDMGTEATARTASSQKGQGSGTQTGSNENPHSALNMGQQTNTPVNDLRSNAAEAPAPYTTPQNINTEDVLRQLVSGVRTAVTDRLSTMELQLNPENLGKMMMKLTSEEGQVTAHITLENENVRAAVENQMAIVKQNLEAQGIKVQEVTVTADAHEFERNLEEGQETSMTDAGSGAQGNAFSGEEEERRQRNGRIGDLDMRSLDSDGMQNLTEDERLAAQIMRDNGNTISINA